MTAKKASIMVQKHRYTDTILLMVILLLIYKLSTLIVGETDLQQTGTHAVKVLTAVGYRVFLYNSSKVTDLDKNYSGLDTSVFFESVNLVESSTVWPLMIMLGLVLVGVYFLALVLMRPLNRVRQLGALGYVPEGGLSMKQMANEVRKRRLAGDVPPVYPNGWFVVLESQDLKVAESKAVSCLGLQLAVFRGEDGRPHIIDGYCPHMGAHLAVGGQVKGNCLECPFHGWKFNGESGKCVHIPYSDAKIPDTAKVKSYICLERNNFIHIWFHAEAAEPYWEPPEIEEITNGEWTYRGRTEHAVNAHIEEIPENGADVAHLGQVHSPILPSGVDLRFTYNKLWSFASHIWRGDWDVCTEEKHVGIMKLTHGLALFGREVPGFGMSVCAKQIGPGLVYLTFDSPVGRGAFIHTLTPTQPLMQRALFHIYSTWVCPSILSKIMLHCEAIMFERDIMIWNNKRYNGKPMFVKSKEDALVAKHRRWFSQFYTENSPRLTLRKDTMDW